MSARVWLSAVLLMGLAQSSFALVEFVSSTEAQRLKSDFDRALPVSKKALRNVTDRDLKCDMYGVRTRLQIERDVMLYRFRAKNAQWENEGAQVVHNYKLSDKDFVGRHGGLTDTIRIVDGRLISELSISTPQATAVVLAYSICHL